MKHMKRNLNGDDVHNPEDNKFIGQVFIYQIQTLTKNSIIDVGRVGK